MSVKKGASTNPGALTKLCTAVNKILNQLIINQEVFIERREEHKRRARNVRTHTPPLTLAPASKSLEKIPTLVFEEHLRALQSLTEYVILKYSVTN